MDAIERLSALFEKFPGIGPRQAGRFVQYLLRVSPAIRRELVDAVQKLSNSVHQCPECMRYHSEKRKECSLCTSLRDDSLLAVVASDVDLAALEKSGTYKGRYFVLGGTISLGSEKTNGLRLKALLSRINDLVGRYSLSEIILAFPANPEGDATAAHLREEISQTSISERNPNIRVTTLGRGLSTGSELEYADPETLKSALENRH
ncbi:recombination protein RecR [Candidatus Kaiserbacteria bacterium]|nr:recombination protein RecR [Candidatus Kaiserbacteria bacterium]